MEPGKVIAITAVEETFLPDVNVAKSKQGAKRQPLRKSLQASSLINVLVSKALVRSGEAALGGNFRLPIRITIMLFDKDFDRRERVMSDFALEPRGGSANNDMLMHFVVAAARLGFGQFFVAA